MSSTLDITSSATLLVMKLSSSGVGKRHVINVEQAGFGLHIVTRIPAPTAIKNVSLYYL